MDNITNYLQETDENGQNKINIDYYRNIIIDYINDYINTSGLDRNKLTGNDFLSIFKRIQSQVFKPHKNTFPITKCNIPYTDYNINALYDLYIDICFIYKVHPSLFQFSILTGLDESTIHKYVTRSQAETLNIRREMLRNDLSNDRMGRIVLANNDSSYGLEYEKKNTIERETVRQGLALNDLPKLE